MRGKQRTRAKTPSEKRASRYCETSRLLDLKRRRTCFLEAHTSWERRHMRSSACPLRCAFKGGVKKKKKKTDLGVRAVVAVAQLLDERAVDERELAVASRQRVGDADRPEDVGALVQQKTAITSKARACQTSALVARTAALGSGVRRTHRLLAAASVRGVLENLLRPRVRGAVEQVVDLNVERVVAEAGVDGERAVAELDAHADGDGLADDLARSRPRETAIPGLRRQCPSSTGGESFLLPTYVERT